MMMRVGLFGCVVLLAGELGACGPKESMSRVGTEPTDTFARNERRPDSEGEAGQGPSLGAAGALLLEQARRGEPLYWRLPGAKSCQVWMLDGAEEGALRRLEPAPLLAFPYAFDEESKSLVVGDEDPALGALGEYGVSALCSEELALESTTVDSVALGHGRWYLSRESCESAGAQSPPDSCLSRMAWALQRREGEPQALAPGSKLEAIYTLGRDPAGRLACKGWSYDGETLESVLSPGDKNSARVRYRVSVESGTVRVSGPSYQDKSGSISSSEPGEPIPLVQVDRNLVFVGGYPWSLNAERCQSLSRLRSKEG